MATHEELLTAARKVYAAQMVAMAGAEHNLRLREAFECVKRELFLGPSPWYVPGVNGPHQLQTLNPIVLYQDLLFTIKSDRQINNGSPSLHAWGLSRLDVKQGDTILHLGTGTGYYTALLSFLVGKQGSVLGVEADTELVNISRRCLEDYHNVQINHGNGSDWPVSPVDAIYVNYAVPRPVKAWFSGLKESGRIIFPLGVPATNSKGELEPYTKFGGFIYAKRTCSKIEAQWLGAVTFVCDTYMNNADRDEYLSLESAFRSGGIEKLCEIRLGERKENEWFSASDWGLLTK